MIDFFASGYDVAELLGLVPQIPDENRFGSCA
jgi:hypothetical protein